jgi:acetyl esterase/lipase
MKGKLYAWVAVAVALGGGGTVAAQEQRARSAFQPDGSIQVPPFNLPPSSFLSREALDQQKSRSQGRMPDRTASTIEELRANMESYLLPSVETFKQRYPVDIVEQTIAGVPTRVFTPKGATPDPKRVLINLHGGGFNMCANACAHTESIPIASIGKFKVVSVDYRQGPEYLFPAASEDVEKVYRELLKTYKPRQIGIYGCSAGGSLTAQVAAWLPSKGLPQAGAIGIFGAGGVRGGRGDSSNLSAALESGAAPPPPPGTPPPANFRSYFEGVAPTEPLAAPGNHPAVLAKFPPTLLITGTRANDMSPAIVTHSRLLKAGVDSNLIVGEGMGHCYITQPQLPEAHDAWDAIVKFFRRHLG